MGARVPGRLGPKEEDFPKETVMHPVKCPYSIHLEGPQIYFAPTLPLETWSKV